MKTIKILLAFLGLSYGTFVEASTPTNLQAQATGTTSINTTWSSPIDPNVVGFTVAYNTVNNYNATGTIWVWVSGNNTFSKSITGLKTATVYFFWVKSEGKTDAYDSPMSAVASATTNGTGTTTGAITSFTCASNGTTSIKLNWTASSPSSFVGYTSVHSINPNPSTSSGATWIWQGNAFTGVINNLSPNTVYNIQIKGEGTTEDKDSPMSQTISCKTDGTVVVGPIHRYAHVVVVIGENTNATSVYGSPNCPYINGLANTGIKFNESYALTHPSQPNYLMLFSGNNQGVTGDGYCGPFNTPNLADNLRDAGFSFKIFSEGLPSIGYDGSASGNYARKHNPLAPFVGTGVNQVPAAINLRWTDFPTDFDMLPHVAFVVPDQCGDGHDNCPPQYNQERQYDDWVRNHLDALIQWAPTHNTLVIVTYDEDDFTSVNRIATTASGSNLRTGASNQPINHYNVLKTICTIFGVPAPSNAAGAAVIDGIGIE